jgi:Potential Queuosine, Q, salvage protein family
MNPFLTNNPNLAKQELLLTAVQDYRPDLVKYDEYLNGYASAELHKTLEDKFYLLDIGIPNTFFIEQATLYAIANASMQYKFWTNGEDGYKRYAKDGKSGAILMSELLNERLLSTINDITNFPLMVDKMIYQLDLFPTTSDIVRSSLLNDFFRTNSKIKVAYDLADAIAIENRVTVNMAKVLAKRLPKMFADPYLKKAQLALFMLASWANINKKTELPVDVSNLTLFADYQVPRVMQQLDLLQYHPCVYKAIGMHIEFPQDSTIEKALRAATVLAGEEIANKYSLPAAVVDNWLWTKRNECTYPHHLTDTSRY